MNPDAAYKPATPEQLAEMRRLEAVFAALISELEQLQAGAENAGQAGLAAGIKSTLDEVGAAQANLVYVRDREAEGDYWAISADKMARMALRWTKVERQA